MFIKSLYSASKPNVSLHTTKIYSLTDSTYRLMFTSQAAADPRPKALIKSGLIRTFLYVTILVLNKFISYNKTQISSKYKHSITQLASNKVSALCMCFPNPKSTPHFGDRIEHSGTV